MAASGSPNPQIAYGEDLISRLVIAASSKEKAAMLSNIVRECIWQACTELCARSHIDKEQIADICMAGNTAMTHLLLNLPVDRLLHAPFVASSMTRWRNRLGEAGAEQMLRATIEAGIRSMPSSQLPP
jgi:uncharacterized 2Fe-2S/4Fe-4S cluster protein (DUF4445 family)